MSGDKKVEYTYDYMNRRVERKVFDWDPELGENGDWESTPSEHTRYVYHGWNVILELNALNSNAILKKYTWGLDLAGQNGAVNSIDAAGGIGGLLACLDTNGTRSFVYAYDANGNVTQLVETTTGGNYGTLQAAYEYDAYGNTVVASFGYAGDNLIRFSTRSIDPETLCGNWLARILDCRLGRWVTRDWHDAEDDELAYRFVRNRPTSRVDPKGFASFDCERVTQVVKTIAPPTALLQARPTITEWVLAAVYISDAVSGSGSGGSNASQATTVRCVWARQFVELFKCCVNGKPMYAWGQPSTEIMFRDVALDKDKPECVQFVLAIDVHNVSVLSFPLTGFLPTDPHEQRLLKNLCRRDEGRPDRLTVPRDNGARPPTGAKIVSHIGCDPKGIAGWPTPGWQTAVGPTPVPDPWPKTFPIEP